jgi:hypothetical protein
MGPYTHQLLFDGLSCLVSLQGGWKFLGCGVEYSDAILMEDVLDLVGSISYMYGRVTVD